MRVNQGAGHQNWEKPRQNVEPSRWLCISAWRMLLGSCYYPAPLAGLARSAIARQTQPLRALVRFHPASRGHSAHTEDVGVCLGA